MFSVLSRRRGWASVHAVHHHYHTFDEYPASESGDLLVFACMPERGVTLCDCQALGFLSMSVGIKKASAFLVLSMEEADDCSVLFLAFSFTFSTARLITSFRIKTSSTLNTVVFLVKGAFFITFFGLCGCMTCTGVLPLVLVLYVPNMPPGPT